MSRRYSSATLTTICAAQGETAASQQTVGTSWFQKALAFRARPRGCHLVTQELEKALQPELSEFSMGLANIFLQHTSASLTINENADPDVPVDMEMALNKIAPEEWNYMHSTEGSDDMPAHVKQSLLGNSLTIPVTNGRLNLGTWQGVWLCEHRNYGGPRRVVVTIQGQKKSR